MKHLPRKSLLSKDDLRRAQRLFALTVCLLSVFFPVGRTAAYAVSDVTEEIETPILSDTGVTESEYSYTLFENGNFNHGTGNTSNANKKPIRTRHFISVGDFIAVKINKGFYVRVFAYDSTYTFLGAIVNKTSIDYQMIVSRYPLCEYVKILDIWETNIADEIVLHPDDPDQKVKNAHYIPADTKIKVGDKEYNTADMLETALRSYLLTRGYDGLELTKYGKNSIDKILAPKAISETDIPETHDYLWGIAPYSETSGNGGYLVMGTKEVNEHCKVKVDILDNWAMRNMNYPMSHDKKISNISGYSGGQLDGYYGSFCPQRALITYAFFFKYMLDNNIDLGANVGNDVIIRSELFGDEGAAPEAEKIKAEWLFSKERMSDYADTFGGTAGKKDTNAGDGGCYVNSNVSPGGKITYVQIEKGSIDVDQKASRIVGSTGHPYVTGPWVGDYWLFTLSNGKELPAGTKAHIQYSTRVSKTGPKFWIAEYFDGEEWKPVVAPDKAEAAGPGVEYNLVMNPNGQEADNVAIDYTFTISKPVTEILYRQRVVSTIQANTGEALEKPNGGTSRIAYNAPDGTPYPPIFETL